ncbi:hypothetical protein CPB84DRAFT_1803569 [Gymnopilus junonius]|uniref:F-box domain-containing protein n=1 Tax=Gymnopilus junonius TaxID=109634 RepID=A0A9P5N9F7_GYMJU|nr:hypothetical protein CPB84DRAFT_1803569 [Gymnopilus junonius]
MNSTAPVLPLELLYLIINAIDTSSSNGRQSLSACSYTNRSFTTLCQERFFRDVEISCICLIETDHTLNFADSEQTTSHKLLTLLAASPHIGSYIQNLTVIVSSPRPRSSGEHSNTSESPFSLYTIIPQLPHLMGFLMPADGLLNWANLEDRMRDVLLSVVQRVTKLDLNMLTYVPVSIFSGCSKLQELRISLLLINRTEMASFPMGDVQLQSLEVGVNLRRPRSHALWFKQPSSPINLSQLRRLILSDRWSTVIDEIREILALCSNTFEELDFWVDQNSTYQPPYPKQPLDLGSFTNLRYLTIRSYTRPYLRPSRGQENDISYITATLKSLPFLLLHHKQVQLDVVVYIDHLPNFDTEVALLPWSDFIDLLDDDSISCYFAHVRLSIMRVLQTTSPALPTDASFEMLTNILDKNKGLKKLRTKGILTYGTFEYFLP